MPRLLSILLVALMVGCATTQPTQAPPDPIALITTAATNIRSASTFRISVNETGPDYMLYTDYATVYFRQATAQYVAPGMMQATIRVLAAGLPIEVQVFSRGADQWYRAIWTGDQWVNQPFAAGFNPETLVAEDTGFQAAMKALIGLKYVGLEQLETGEQVDHLAATANGPDVAALLGDLIEPVGTVEVDVYVDTSTKFPARFVITEHDSPYAVTPQAGQQAQPVVWTIDLNDINAPADIATPEALNATPEATGNLLAPETEAATPEASS